MNARALSDLQLTGWRLVGARAFGAAMFIAMPVIFAQSIPARAAQLTTVALQHQRALDQLGLGVRFLPAYLGALDLITFAACFVVALIIILRKSDDRMTVFVSTFLLVYGFSIVRPPESLAEMEPALRAWMNGVRTIGAGGALIFTFLFPDGRFVPRWTRWIAALWGAWAASYTFFPESALNPELWRNPLRAPIFLGVFLIGLIAQVYRYARVSTPAQRQQTKWVLLGLIFFLLGYALFFLPPIFARALIEDSMLRLGYTLIGVPVFYFGALMFPLLLAFAISRYRLWDIDLVVSRTLVYTLLTLALGVIYYSNVVLLQQIFRVLTGQLQSELVTVMSTLAIAALFNPLRRRVQDGIDRRFNRRKYNAARVLAAFSATARDEVDMAKLQDALETVVNETMRPGYVSLWLKPTAQDAARSTGTAGE
ncbi:MAG: hypothetical protein HY868_02270 [Chloroflexi bacterium]|nr:hypothetical protein [Chloroflexota bacterium]